MISYLVIVAQEQQDKELIPHEAQHDVTKLDPEKHEFQVPYQGHFCCNNRNCAAVDHSTKSKAQQPSMQQHDPHAIEIHSQTPL